MVSFVYHISCIMFRKLFNLKLPTNRQCTRQTQFYVAMPSRYISYVSIVVDLRCRVQCVEQPRAYAKLWTRRILVILLLLIRWHTQLTQYNTITYIRENAFNWILSVLSTNLCIGGCSILHVWVWATGKMEPPLYRAPSASGVSGMWNPTVRGRVATRVGERYGDDAQLVVSACYRVTRLREKACKSQSGKHPSQPPLLSPPTRVRHVGIRCRRPVLSPAPLVQMQLSAICRRRKSRDSDSFSQPGTRY